jgi:hypothetical protein
MLTDLLIIKDGVVEILKTTSQLMLTGKTARLTLVTRYADSRST